MDYRRYAFGHYARSAWIRCDECGPSPDEPVYVWQGSDREINLALPINAVMHHEIAAHASNPASRIRK